MVSLTLHGCVSVMSPSVCDVFHCLWCLSLGFRLYSRQRKYAEFADQKFEKVIDLVERVDGRDCLQLVPILIEYGKVRALLPWHFTCFCQILVSF